MMIMIKTNVMMMMMMKGITNDKCDDDDYDKDKCEVVGSPPWGLLKPAKQIHPSYTPGQT